jgi:hypothetical protein
VLQVVPALAQFPDTTLGTFSRVGAPSGPYLLNNTQTTDTINPETDVSFSGPGADDYVITAGQCAPEGVFVIVLTPGLFCFPDISFLPGALGNRSATMTIQGSADASPIAVSLHGTGTVGYYQVDSLGHVAHAGDAGISATPGMWPSTSPSWEWHQPVTMGVTGWWPEMVASSPSATPPSTVRRGTSTSTNPSWG